MKSSRILIAAAAYAALASAAFNAKAKTNVVTYWGQGANQDRLLVTCQNPSYDIINIGFVDVFPDQGAGGWPGTNFGNACWGDVYEHNGVNTSLLKTCPNIGPDVIECQQTYGKKIFLSIGGGNPSDYWIKNAKSGQNFANFLWAAFGPVSATKSSVPRPWGNATVDGFDFDIENLMDPAPQTNYQSSGYAAMINRFKNVLFAQDTSKQYYISGAPQCPIPDSHLSAALSSAWFDFFWIQFYNSPQCSARAGIQSLAGKGTNDISYTKWTQQTSKNPNVKMYIGLPASKTAAIDSTYFLTPAEVQKLVNEFYSNTKFGGIMLWEATAAQNQTPCNVDYGTWMKNILSYKSSGKTYPTNTKTCAGVSKRSDFGSGLQHVALVEKRSYTVDTCTRTRTHINSGSTSLETYETTQTLWPTIPSGYALLPSSYGFASASASSVPQYVTSASAAAYPSSMLGYVSSVSTAAYPSSKSSLPTITAYGSVSVAVSTQPAIYTSISDVTVLPVPAASSLASPPPYVVSGGNGTAAWGTASASGSKPTASSGWILPATGGAATQSLSISAVVAGSLMAILLF